jgi:hypothetical protein
VIGIGARGLATVGADTADHANDVADLGARTNRLRLIDEEIAKLKEVKVTEDNALAIEIARRGLENQRLEQLVKESLAMRGASDGVRAFFIEMQKDAESAAEIVYKALNSSVDRVSSNLAKMMTQKPPKGGWAQEWAKSFQDIGGSMVQSSLKSLMQTGLGKLVIGGKPDGSSGNPLWVRMAGMSFGMPGAGLNPGGGGGSVGLNSLAGAALKGTGSAISQSSPLIGGLAALWQHYQLTNGAPMATMGEAESMGMVARRDGAAKRERSMRLFVTCVPQATRTWSCNRASKPPSVRFSGSCGKRTPTVSLISPIAPTRKRPSPARGRYSSMALAWSSGCRGAGLAESGRASEGAPYPRSRRRRRASPGV